MKLKIQDVLNRYLGRYGEPAADDVDLAVEHVWQKLKSEAVRAEAVKIEEESRNTWYFPIFATAATVLVVAFSILLVRGFFLVTHVVSDQMIDARAGRRHVSPVRTPPVY